MRLLCMDIWFPGALGKLKVASHLTLMSSALAQDVSRLHLSPSDHLVLKHISFEEPLESLSRML